MNHSVRNPYKKDVPSFPPPPKSMLVLNNPYSKKNKLQQPSSNVKRLPVNIPTPIHRTPNYNILTELGVIH